MQCVCTAWQAVRTIISSPSGHSHTVTVGAHSRNPHPCTHTHVLRRFVPLMKLPVAMARATDQRSPVVASSAVSASRLH